MFKNLLLGALFLFPILPLKVSAAILILNVVVILLSAIYNLKTGQLPLVKPALPAIIMFGLPLLYLVFFFFSEHPQVAWFQFEKKLALLVSPVLFYIVSHSKVQININNLLKSFIAASLVLATITIVIFFYSLATFDESLGTFAYQVRTLNEELTQLHPTYLGLHLISAAFIAFHFYLKKIGPLNSNWSFVGISVLLIGAALSGSRSPFIALILGVLYFVISNKKFSRTLKLGVSVLVLLLPILLIQIPVIGDRFQGIVELFQKNFFSPNSIDTSIRLVVAWCDVGLVRKFWLWGVGPGAVQHHLNICYQMIDLETARSQELNTHNEFINVWLGTGIFGFTLFLSLFVSAWIHFKHWLPKIFLILFGVVCLTENLLSRQQGVFYAAFFFSLFIFFPIKEDS